MTEGTVTLFSGNLNIYYGQYYIDTVTDPEEDSDSDEAYLEPDEAFVGQTNGICGSAMRGKLFFVTGIRDGVASIAVELLESPPTLDDQYDECVEVPFQNPGAQLFLCEWACEEAHPLKIPTGEYRVRYSIAAMDKDYEDDSDFEQPISGQRYLIQLWPSDQRPDEIIKRSSEIAAYWHRAWRTR